MDNLNKNPAAQAVEDSLNPEYENSYRVAVKDDKYGRGFDLPSVLFNQRQIFLHGEVRQESVWSIQQQLQYLAGNSKETKRDRRIVLRIDSPGGLVLHGLGIDTHIQHVKEMTGEPFYCLVENSAASMGSLLTQSADVGCRLMMPHAEMMIHESAFGYQGKSSEHAANVGNNVRVETRLFDAYVKKMVAAYCLFENKQPSAKLEKQAMRQLLYYMKGKDTFLTAEQAMKLYLVDYVIHTNKLQQDIYAAIEMYRGLRQSLAYNAEKCATTQGGAIHPFKFGDNVLSDKQKEKQKAEAIAQLRKLRKESLQTCRDEAEAMSSTYDALKEFSHARTNLEHDTNDIRSVLESMGTLDGADEDNPFKTA